MSDEYVIIGSGGLAKEMRFLLIQRSIHNIFENKDSYWNTFCNPITFLGYIDNTPKIIHGEKVIGDDEWLLNRKELTNVIFGIGSPKIVCDLVKKYKQNENLLFPNVIHPLASGDFINIKMGQGNIITAGTIFTTDISMGDFNIFNLNTTVGHDAVIGNFNLFNPSSNISGNVKIGNTCLFGTGCHILEKISIADRSIIGAGAVVNKSIVETDGVYVGVPFQRIK